MSKYAGEKVLVIERALFDSLGSFQGHRADSEAYIESILRPENNHFMDRDAAEEDVNFKQIIPYAIFKAGDAYLTYERGKSGGENRLHAKLSLGIGGHINPVDDQGDAMGKETYFAAIEREFNEELNIDCGFKIKTLGLVNDDGNDVGKVHLGVIHLVELESPAVTANEDGIANLQFLTLEQLSEEGTLSRLESWSQIAVDLLKQKSL